MGTNQIYLCPKLTLTSRPELPCVLAPRAPRGPSHRLEERKELAQTPFVEVPGCLLKPREGLAPGRVLGTPPPVGMSHPVPCHRACSRLAVPASTEPGHTRS